MSTETRANARGSSRSNDPSLLILISLLSGAKHGYGLLLDIEDFAQTRLGPGTLYGAIGRLEGRGLIEAEGQSGRTRPYRLTAAGSEFLEARVAELRTVVDEAVARLNGLARSDVPAVGQNPPGPLPTTEADTLTLHPPSLSDETAQPNESRAELPAAAETRSISETRQLVVFTLGAEEYALPMGKVREVIRYTEPRSVDPGSFWVRGVISLRGKIIPVCDLATRLSVQREHDPSSAKIVIVDADSGAAGLIVDEVNEVLIVDGEQLDPVPAAGSDFIEAVARIDQRLVVLLDPDLLLAATKLWRPAETSAP